MKRDPRLAPLSSEHHHGLVMALRIEREVEGDAHAVARLYSDLLAFWARGLLPHFRVEQECLLARLIRHVSPESASVSRTQTDHLDIEALVACMRDTSDDSGRREALRRFGRRLRDHIRWEEQVLFSVAEQHFSGAELDALARDLADYGIGATDTGRTASLSSNG